jgi:hypothetical protein
MAQGCLPAPYYAADYIMRRSGCKPTFGGLGRKTDELTLGDEFVGFT